MAQHRQGIWLASQPDDRLVSLARAGDEQAFAAIVERYRRELLAHASRLRSDGRADDLVQQTFLSAFAALRSGTEVRHLRGWLYRILRNEVIHTSSRSILEVELDPASIASEPLEEASQRRMLAFETLSSIAALPSRQRHAIVATALDGESRAAVAGSMGLTEGAVRQLMHRARTALRAAVAALTPSPLANWLGSARGAAANQAPEILIGAGTTSGAGVAVKLGAILATGALASGIVGSQLVSSGHPGTGSQANRRLAVRNAAAVGAPGAAKGTGPFDVGVAGARVRAGSGGGGRPTPTESRNAASGRGTTAKGGHDGAPAPARHGASRHPAGTRVTTTPSRGDSGSGGDHHGSVGESSATGGTTEHAGGSSTGADGSGSGGGSVVDGGSQSTSGRDDGSGDSTAASIVGVAPTSGGGGHDGGSSEGGTVSTTGSSDGGGSTTGGSTDGGSSGGRSSDGGSGDSGTSGSSSTGR